MHKRKILFVKYLIQYDFSLFINISFQNIDLLLIKSSQDREFFYLNHMGRVRKENKF